MGRVGGSGGGWEVVQVSLYNKHQGGKRSLQLSYQMMI